MNNTDIATYNPIFRTLQVTPHTPYMLHNNRANFTGTAIRMAAMAGRQQQIPPLQKHSEQPHTQIERINQQSNETVTTEIRRQNIHKYVSYK
jgi:hypothetical protein